MEPLQTPVAVAVVAAPPRGTDRWLLALSALGLAFMSYLTYVHFKPSGSSLCNFGAAFSCDLVNKSTYAELFGVPVSIIGLAYFAFIAFLALRPAFPHRYHIILLATAGSLAFSAFLTYIEVYVLDSVCVFCEASKLVMVGVLVVSWRANVSYTSRVLVTRVGAALGAGALGTAAWRFLSNS